MSFTQICINEIGGDMVIAAVPNMFTLARSKMNTVMFKSNSYLDRLNKTLQLEMRAISAYHGVLQREARKPLEITQVEHKDAGKQLVNLIISNQGIPDEEATIGSGFAKTVVGICSSIPAKIFEQAAFKTLTQIEKGLVSNYERLIDDAPARDVAVLKHLHYCTSSHIEDLKKFS